MNQDPFQATTPIKLPRHGANSQPSRTPDTSLDDIIVIHGRDHRPRDIEITVEEAMDFIRHNGCVATSIVVDGEERLVLVVEANRELIRRVKAVRKQQLPSSQEPSAESAKAREALDRSAGAIAVRIRDAVILAHDISLYALAFVEPKFFPHAVGGEVDRRSCHALFLEHKDKVLFFWDEYDETGELEEKPADDELSILTYIEEHDPSLDPTRQRIHDCLVDYLKREKHLDVDRIDYDRPFTSLGIDFLGITAIREALEKVLDREISLDALFEFGTIDKLAIHVGPITDWLVERIRRMANIPRTEVDTRRPFLDYGLRSDTAKDLLKDLGEWLGRPLLATLTYDYPNIEALAEYLTHAFGDRVRVAKNPAADFTAQRSAADDGIAIIGMGCRFPKAKNPDEFWDLLKNSVDAITEVPPSRWTPVDLTVPWGGFIDDVDQFDPAFFGISAREAETVDPQQRLLLEVGWEALENAGIAADSLSGSQTGVFVGICHHDYNNLLLPVAENLYFETGNHFSISACRLSYLWDLRGPSKAVDTACSSSLVALHDACQSLRQGECGLALAGGVNLILHPGPTEHYAASRMLSPDGHCKTFDASADGYVRGEGCGVVVLKRVEDAMENGDPILAVIRGSAINQDGRTNGLTAPNGQAQQAVIRQALANAGVNTQEIGYIEAHGTGTPLGDPIEFNSLKEVLTPGRPPDEICYIGSVKTNVGHLEAAAGIAGLIKTVLVLQHREIPPHLHLKELSPHLAIADTPLSIPTQPTPWPENPTSQSGRRKLAGVSSFGFGGTNTHVILEEAPAIEPVTDVGANQCVCPEEPHACPPERPLHLLTLSAKSETALRELAGNYVAHLEAHPETPFADICFTAATGRAHFEHRLALVAGSSSDARARLETADYTVGVAATERPKIAFLFTGQGSQYPGMGRQLYETEALFRETLDRCDEILRPLGVPLLDLLYSETTDPDAPNQTIHQTIHTQPALFSLEYALARVWQSWGVKPDAVMGHSVGEYVAACVAGVFGLEDGLKLIAARGRLMQTLCEPGDMLALPVGERDALELIAPLNDKSPDELSIAAINGPVSVVVSGKPKAMETLSATLAEKDIKAKPLSVSHAFHSAMMVPMLAEFERAAGAITYFRPGIALCSNVTGEMATDEVTDPAYWVRHVREPVRFAAGVKTLHEEGIDAFLEVGPKPALLGMAGQCLPEDGAEGTKAIFIPSLREGRDDWRQLLQSLGQWYIQGGVVDWRALDRTPDNKSRRHKVSLPTYPFQRQRYWIDKARLSRRTVRDSSAHPLLGQKLQLADAEKIRFESEIDLLSVPWLADHRVFDAVVLPATGYMEMVLAAGIAISDEPFLIEQVAIEQALILPEEEAATIQLVLSPEDRGYRFQVFSLGKTSYWTPHVTGQLVIGELEGKTEMLDPAKLRAQCVTELPVADHYRMTREHGINYGPDFQAVKEIFSAEGLILGQAELSETLAVGVDNYQLHPVLFDAALQLGIAVTLPSWNGETYLPVGMDRLQVYRRAGARVQVLAEAVGADEKTVTADVSLFDDAGVPIARLKGFTLGRVSHETLQNHFRSKSNNLYEIAWQTHRPETTLPTPDTSSGIWLILADHSGMGRALARRLNEKNICILVYADVGAPPCGRLDDNNAWHLNPAEPSGFQCLFAESFQKETPPLRGVVHLWSLDTPDASELTAETLAEAQILGCGSVLHLLQAQIQQEQAAKLWLVTRNAINVEQDQDPLSVIQAPLWGLGKVIALEHPELWGGLIDNPAVDDLLLEIQAGVVSEEKEDQIAYRNGQRYVARLVKSGLTASDGGSSFESENSYLITGGLGALGLKIARWMVERGARHLVLAGRGGPSSEARDVLQQLEETGAEILVVSADVSDQTRIARLFEEINDRMPSLRGIVHAAGVLDREILVQENWTHFSSAMAAKVAGSWHLHTLTQAMPLDFFVCFSSGASLLGGRSMGNYAAANAFMDALVYFRRALGLPGLSINWGAWAGDGMGVTFLGGGNGGSSDKLAKYAMPSEVALQILDILMVQTDVVQVGVLPGDLSSYLQEIYPGDTPPFLSEFTRSPSPLPAIESVPIRQRLAQAPEEEYEEILTGFIRNRLANVLGTSPSRLDVQQPLDTMGLDSLMAMELRNRIHSELDADVSMAKLMQGPSIFGLVEQIIEQIGKQSTKTHTLEKVSQTKTSHPLSHGQRAFWFLYQNAPDSPAYNTAAVMRILSSIDVPALRVVFQTLLDRHPSLRTTFSQRDGQPIQIVHSHRDLHFERIDASMDTEEALHRRVAEAYRRPFDLEQGPLLRISLFTRAQEDHVLLVTMHHIMNDAWSIWTLLSEFLTLYLARTTGKAPTLPPLRWQYPDFVKWQTELLAGPEGERLWEYWRKQLSDAPPMLALPTDRPRSPVQSDNGASITFRLSESLTQQLKEQAQNSGVTLYMILLAAFQVLLHRYTGQEDILVGSPIVGRARPEFEGIFGLFMNPIALRARLEGDPSFASFLNQVRQTVLEGLAHQDYPISLLIERLQLARDASHSPLVQVYFLLQKSQQDGELSTLLLGSNDDDSKVNEGGLLLTPFKMAQQEGQSDLTLEMLEAKRALFGNFKYNTDLFETATIERMVGHFQQLLEGIVAAPETEISRLPILTRTERQRILVEWNDTAMPYPKDKCIHELFEEQVARTPDALAVIFETEEVSYGELNARANRLANRLRALGVGPEVLVGLFVERSVEMVVGLLAILKAGGAYVPLDPEYPQERLAFMAEDADLKVLLCHGATWERVPKCAVRILDMDAEAAGIAGESSDNPVRLAGANNLAYVIYTSGSTGKPKGVMLEHGNVSNFLHTMSREPGFSESDVLLSVTTLSFDISVLEIFLPLLFGGQLVIAARADAQDGHALIELIGKHGVTLLQATPATWRLLETENWKNCSTLKALCGGEALPGDLADTLSRHVSALWNMYGPTETTVWSLVKRILPGETVSIGYPIGNTQIYVVDSQNHPVPTGIAGELYIGGAGVARGYLNRPELTAERFIPDLFSHNPDARLYRTGDLCRWLPDGNVAKGNAAKGDIAKGDIEYLGRIDTQVKLRGFRIELGEVESALLMHPDVREAVVDARGKGMDKKLVAWVIASVGAKDFSPLRDNLRTHLRALLPDWMAPSVFMFVESLPLTPNGKIDRRSLPDPDTSDLSALAFVAPATPTEELLAGLWAVVLKREGISRHDDFFDLGGHSLLATQLISRIRDSFQVDLPVRAVFEQPKLLALAAAIKSASAGLSFALPPIEPQSADSPKAPSFAQQRLWFLDRYEEGKNATYSMPVALRLSGPLDIEALRASLGWMVERHQSLRTCFPETDGVARVGILPASAFEFPIHDLRRLPSAERWLQQRVDEHATEPFDLACGPLFRAEFLQLGKHHDQDINVLLINMHHIISDGWSLGVLVREWEIAYTAFVRGESPTLTPLPFQYSDYAAWQRQWLQGDVLAAQLAYWKDNLAGIPELLALPTDYPRPAQQSYQGAYRFQTLPADITTALKAFSREQGVTSS